MPDSGPPTATPARHTIVDRHPDTLILDSRNPRLAGEATETGVGLYRQLINTQDLRELLSSIAANGYVSLEPLIVQASDAEPGRYVVLEGNRRLAAVKILRDRSLWEELRLPEYPMTPEHRASLDALGTIEVQERDDARELIGFKHINGPQKWTAYAKAQFALNWWRAERRSGDGGVGIEEIARRLGDEHKTLRRMVQGLLLVEQAEKQRLFDRENLHPASKFYFSHLYTALGRKQYQEFLGLEDVRSSEPVEDPVPEDRLDRLGEVLTWLYGSRDDDRLPEVRRQNPDVKRLGEVLAVPAALNRLRADQGLDTAHEEVRPGADRFSDALTKALKFAEQAVTLVGVADRADASLMETARLLRYQARAILTLLQQEPDDDD